MLVLGRDADCDVVLNAASVSGRHARLLWDGSQLLIEDLESVNGTWVRGERVQRAGVKPGMDVRLADVPVPWSDPAISALLRQAGAGARTIAAMPKFGRYRCPACRSNQLVPPGFVRGELRCAGCGAELMFDDAHAGPRSRVWRGVRTMLIAFTFVAITVAAILRWRVESVGGAQVASAPVVQLVESFSDPAASPEEHAVRVYAANLIRGAIDPSNPITRNLAVEVAGADDGPFHVEQVARIWKHVRLAWRYVNDPRGAEYFARASETITNSFAGDCDDFAIVLAAMIEAIGGRTRVVLMDGPAGGHAYTEVCIEGPPDEVSQKIARFYRRSWDRRLGTRPSQPLIHFRNDATCPVWLNLDWSTNVIGGPYTEERYAIAVYAEGRTETLHPAVPDQRSTQSTRLPARRPLAQ